MGSRSVTEPVYDSQYGCLGPLTYRKRLPCGNSNDGDLSGNFEVCTPNFD